ncbi:hypothetical protein [Mucilaginibacter dorajii]|uniref:Transmembrane protein n=1 Tax=Mucilaginibacter dorajii TaxID=692994 RepID=A0ABP7QL20_9SPHI|nr:hypothetical protein [Mucilaginibacter dorajii]MCS3734097.1 hypothetical protein [Mucilaginibacter dorajii]
MKTFLPVIIAFMGFALFVIVSDFTRAMQIGDMGEGNIHAFMACFYYCWPLYFVVAILTQWIIIKPVWNAIVLHSALGALTTFIIVAVVCALAAGGVAYFIWDENAGYDNLTWLATIMLFIQLAYWGVNFFIMFLVTGKTVTLKHAMKKKSPTQPSPEGRT